jgi:hypothetical protein
LAGAASGAPFRGGLVIEQQAITGISRLPLNAFLATGETSRNGFVKVETDESQEAGEGA